MRSKKELEEMLRSTGEVKEFTFEELGTVLEIIMGDNESELDDESKPGDKAEECREVNAMDAEGIRLLLTVAWVVWRKTRPNMSAECRHAVADYIALTYEAIEEILEDDETEQEEN